MAHLDNLNAAQLNAVTSESKVLQVLAPPGSGKTKTLTSRVAHLLGDRGFLPWNVICLTFTNKSAREMKERVGTLIGEDIGNRVILGTFHSVCRRYLSYYGHFIGVRKGFGIADTSDTNGIVKRIIKRGNINLELSFVRNKISKCKSKNIGHQQLLAETTGKKAGVDQHEFISAFQQYEEYLQASNLLDYDDLLLRCAELLRNHPECVNNVQAVLIDEFQDTNVIQFDLMTLFAQKCGHVTTVGDPDQSIYGWRSAEVANLAKMQSRWPETVVINLEQNYRSAGAILELAQGLIEQDTSRPGKALVAVHCRGTTPVLRRLYSARHEAAWIVSEIKRAAVLSAGILDHSDFAVLVRSAALSRPIEAAFGKDGIPYRMVGGAKFFDRVEVKLLLDYLRIIALPSNNDALARIVNLPARKIGKETIKALLEEATERKCTMWQVVSKAVQGSKTSTKLTKPQIINLSVLYDIVVTCRARLEDDHQTTPKTLLEYLAKKLNLQTYLQSNYKEDHEMRWENVEQLFAQADDPILFSSASENLDEALPILDGAEQQVSSGPAEALARFLANVSLQSDKQIKDGFDSEGNPLPEVTISTIHAAKGLEWPVVFIPACYQGSIPHSRAEDIDEERRLLYVAMTRAKALLNMSCPTRSSTNEETTLSPFLDDLAAKDSTLHPKGHMFEYRTMEGIASILGRDSPGASRLAAAVATCDPDHIIDDEEEWPLDGTKGLAELERAWSGQQDDHDFGTATLGSKRRKVSEQQDATSVRKQVVSKLYAATTMDGAGQFTVPGQPMGFVSATQEMQIQRSVEATRGGREISRDSSEDVKNTVKPIQPRGIKREAGQASLASWFTGGTSTNSATTLAAASQPVLTEPAPVSASRTSGRLPGIIQASRTLPRTASAPENRPAMAPAPAAAVNKNLRPMSTMTSLRKPIVEYTGTGRKQSQPDIFLSSSPPPDDATESQRQMATAQNCQSMFTHANQPLVQTATTMHTTTISRIAGAQRANGVRRLGMRGPMTGWNSKGQGGTKPSSFHDRT